MSLSICLPMTVVFALLSEKHYTMAAAQLQECITDSNRWMNANRLKLNTQKTACLCLRDVHGWPQTATMQLLAAARKSVTNKLQRVVKYEHGLTPINSSCWVVMARCGRSSHVQIRLDSRGLLYTCLPDARLSVWAMHARVAERQHLRSASSHLLVVPTAKVPDEHVRSSCLHCDIEIVLQWSSWCWSEHWQLSTHSQNVSVPTITPCIQRIAGTLRSCAVQIYI